MTLNAWIVLTLAWLCWGVGIGCALVIWGLMSTNLWLAVAGVVVTGVAALGLFWLARTLR